MKPRSKSFYDELGNFLKQKVETCFPNVTIKKVGSRPKGEHRRTSDLDFQIEVHGAKTTREQFYPKLIECLKNDAPKFQGETLRVKLGDSGNVVNVFPEKGGKVSFALMPPYQKNTNGKSFQGTLLKIGFGSWKLNFSHFFLIKRHVEKRKMGDH